MVYRLSGLIHASRLHTTAHHHTPRLGYTTSHARTGQRTTRLRFLGLNYLLSLAPPGSLDAGSVHFKPFALRCLIYFALAALCFGCFINSRL
jgi:hypothetical protein